MAEISIEITLDTRSDINRWRDMARYLVKNENNDYRPSNPQDASNQLYRTIQDRLYHATEIVSENGATKVIFPAPLLKITTKARGLHLAFQSRRTGQWITVHTLRRSAFARRAFGVTASERRAHWSEVSLAGIYQTLIEMARPKKEGILNGNHTHCMDGACFQPVLGVYCERHDHITRNLLLKALKVLVRKILGNDTLLRIKRLPQTCQDAIIYHLLDRVHPKNDEKRQAAYLIAANRLAQFEEKWKVHSWSHEADYERAGISQDKDREIYPIKKAYTDIENGESEQVIIDDIVKYHLTEMSCPHVFKYEGVHTMTFAKIMRASQGQIPFPSLILMPILWDVLWEDLDQKRISPQMVKFTLQALRSRNSHRYENRNWYIRNLKNFLGPDEKEPNFQAAQLAIGYIEEHYRTQNAPPELIISPKEIQRWDTSRRDAHIARLLAKTKKEKTLHRKIYENNDIFPEEVITEHYHGRRLNTIQEILNQAISTHHDVDDCYRLCEDGRGAIYHITHISSRKHVTAYIQSTEPNYYRTLVQAVAYGNKTEAHSWFHEHDFTSRIRELTHRETLPEPEPEPEPAPRSLQFLERSQERHAAARRQSKKGFMRRQPGTLTYVELINHLVALSKMALPEFHLHTHYGNIVFKRFQYKAIKISDNKFIGRTTQAIKSCIHKIITTSPQPQYVSIVYQANLERINEVMDEIERRQAAPNFEATIAALVTPPDDLYSYIGTNGTPWHNNFQINRTRLLEKITRPIRCHIVIDDTNAAFIPEYIYARLQVPHIGGN